MRLILCLIILIIGFGFILPSSQAFKLSSHDSAPPTVLAQLGFNSTETFTTADIQNPDYVTTWLEVSPDGSSWIDLPISMEPTSPNEPGRYNALTYRNSFRSEILSTLTNGIDNRLDFQVGIGESNGGGVSRPPTGSIPRGFESEHFAGQKAIDFVGEEILNITLVINQLSLNTQGNQHVVNLDIAWIFYGYPHLDPGILTSEDPNEQELDDNEDTTEPLGELQFVSAQQVFFGILLVTPLIGLVYTWRSQIWIFNQDRIRFTKAIIGQFREIFSSQTPELLGISGALYSKKPPDTKKATDLEQYPQEILQFKFLLHPARMAIIKILFNSLQVTSVDLQTKLGLSRSEMSFHLKKLEEKQYIGIFDKFVEASVRQVVELLPPGIQRFKELTAELLKFLTDNHSLLTYLDNAKQIMDKDKKE